MRARQDFRTRVEDSLGFEVRLVLTVRTWQQRKAPNQQTIMSVFKNPVFRFWVELLPMHSFVDMAGGLMIPRHKRSTGELRLYERTRNDMISPTREHDCRRIDTLGSHLTFDLGFLLFLFSLAGRVSFFLFCRFPIPLRPFCPLFASDHTTPRERVYIMDANRITSISRQPNVSAW